MADPFTLTRRQGAAAFIVTTALLLLPLLFVRIPPLHDYLFHVARVDMLHRWDTAPAFHTWYERSSFLLANVGMDVVGEALNRLMSIAAASRVYIALVIVATLSGMVFLHRCLHGRATIWPYVIAFFIYNWIFVFGFAGYLLGVGLMLWACGAWVLLHRAGVAARLVAGSVICLLLLFCHLVPFALYALFVAGYELQAAWQMRRGDARTAWGNLFVGAAPFVLPLILLAMSSTGEGGHFTYTSGWYLGKLLKFRALLAADWVLDLSLIAVFGVMLAVVWRRMTVTFANAVALALVLLTVFMLVLPVEIMSSWYADTRIVIAIGFIVIAALQIDVTGTALRRGVIGTLLVYLAFRSIYLAYQWRAYDSEMNELLASLSQVRANAILLVATAAGVGELSDIDLHLWQPPLRFAPSLLTLQKPVFVANSYAERGKQPLVVRPEYQALYDFRSYDNIDTPTAAAVDALAARMLDVAAATGHADEPLYVLLLYPDHLAGAATPGLTEVVRGPRYVLYALNAAARP